MKYRIRTKLLFFNLILILVALSILILAVLFPLQDYYLKQVESELVKNGRLISRLFKQDLLAKNYLPIDQVVKEVGQEIATRITVINADGQILGETHQAISQMENHADRPEFKTALQGQIGTAIRYSTTLESHNLYVALPFIEQGEVKAVIRLAVPIMSIQETIALLRTGLFIGALIAFLIALFLSIYLAGTFTKPIEEITAKANKIAKGDLEQRIYNPAGYELALLGNSINHMTASLKEQINQINTSKQSLEAILTNMASGVIVINQKGQIENINPQAKNIFGIEAEDVEGRPYHQVIRNFSFLENIDEVFKKQILETVYFELSLSHPRELTVRIYATPIIYEDKIQRVVIVCHDITSLKQLEKLKTDFVANASHELRTPVASIKGFAETLLVGALEDKDVAERFIAIIHKEAERMSKLINDLLDLSRLEIKNLEIKKSLVNVEKLVEESVSYLAEQARKKNIKIEIKTEKQLPQIYANREMLKRAFLNLIDNGIKYTPQGGSINITAFSQDGYVIIKFADTGIGIPQEDLPRIFERFYRVDKARSNKFKGTGLGLSIVKHIIEQHQGAVEVESEVGKGTTFIVKLPG